MATKISISKALEKRLRDVDTNAVDLVEEIIAILDGTQAYAAAADKGLSAQAFLKAVQEYRPVVLPQHNGAARTYQRLTKTLRDLGVTVEQAHLLGQWLKAQTWLHELTVERFLVALPEWLTRALASKPAFKKSVWASQGTSQGCSCSNGCKSAECDKV